MMTLNRKTDREYEGVYYEYTVRFLADKSRQYCVTVDCDRMTEWFNTQEEAFAQFKEMVDY